MQILYAQLCIFRFFHGTFKLLDDCFDLRGTDRWADVFATVFFSIKSAFSRKVKHSFPENPLFEICKLLFRGYCALSVREAQFRQIKRTLFLSLSSGPSP